MWHAWDFDLPLPGSSTTLVITFLWKPLLSRSAIFNIAHIAEEDTRKSRLRNLNCKVSSVLLSVQKRKTKNVYFLSQCSALCNSSIMNCTAREGPLIFGSSFILFSYLPLCDFEITFGSENMTVHVQKILLRWRIKCANEVIVFAPYKDMTVKWRIWSTDRRSATILFLK